MDDSTAGQHPEIRDASRAAHVAWRVVRLFLAAYLVVVLVMVFLETGLVYPIPPVERGDWHPLGLNHEDVWFESDDGTHLHGWFVPHPHPKRAVLYCHGNGEHIGDNTELAGQIRDTLDASVFMFDYRGYGHSAGTPDESGCIADGLAAQRWLAHRVGAQTSDLVLVGRSLGTGVAVALAAQQGAHALVLENAFSRMTDVAAHHYPWLPVRLIMRNRYDSVRGIQSYHGPLLQSHGTGDTIAPLELGRRLFNAAASDNKKFLEFRGLGHNDPPPPHYHGQLASFLDELGGNHTPPETPSGR